MKAGYYLCYSKVAAGRLFPSRPFLSLSCSLSLPLRQSLSPTERLSPPVQESAGGMVVSDIQLITDKESIPHGYCYIAEHLEQSERSLKKQKCFLGLVIRLWHEDIRPVEAVTECVWHDNQTQREKKRRKNKSPSSHSAWAGISAAVAARLQQKITDQEKLILGMHRYHFATEQVAYERLLLTTYRYQVLRAVQ